MILLSHPLVTEPVPIFFIVLAIILMAPLLLNKLKIPHIIGMIVAGVIVGPYGLNILADDSSFAIFGQVGLLYLMFLAGLEIDMFHLRINLRRGAVFGALTLVVPLAIGVIASVYLLRLDWTTSWLLGAMYASHTLISYPVAARLGVTRSPAVLISIVGTIVAVVGALLVLAGAVSVRREGEFNFVAILLLLMRLAVWCVALILILPRITRRFFKTYNDKVTQYVFVLAMVFLSAWTAQLIDLEPVLGAFLAGLVLNRYVPVGSPLMSSIEFVGNALFIPYFLISVGMMINLGVVLQGDTLAVAGVMLAVALAGKWIPAWIAQKSAGLGASSRRVMFGLTAAHTAVALAVVTLGYNMHMFDETILNATVLVILVTCALAPLITAYGAQRLKIHMLTADGGELVHTVRTNHSLIAVANPLTAGALVEMAVLMRNDRGRHSFFAVHVRDDNSKSARSVSKLALDAAVTTAAAADINLQTLDRYDISTVTGLLNTIEERDITEIILGMHRRQTVIDSFLGSKIDQLLRGTNRMIILSRCYIPLSTVTRIIVWVPRGAQYETGFSRWIRCISRLTRQIGCRIMFACAPDLQPLIRAVIYQENYGIRCEFDTVEEWSDFIVRAVRIGDDDLLVVVSARPTSLSWDDSMLDIPSFLQRYCSRNNLMLIYPGQFGEGSTATVTSFSDPMSSDITNAPSPLWSKLRAYRRLLHNRRRRHRRD